MKVKRFNRLPKKCRCDQIILLILFLSLVGLTTLVVVYTDHSFNKHQYAGKLISSFIHLSKQNFISKTSSASGSDNSNVLYDSEVPISVRLSVVKPQKKRLAYIITITKDGFFQDGAAVLAYSIIKQSRNSEYSISFIAFVHPNVTTSRIGLKRLGFHVIEVPTPVNASAIKFQFLRDHIDKNGCCGAAELIKLTSYRLEQYHRVIHLDADTMLLNPINELFERNYSLIYTTDPNMATHKGIEKMPVQGGFIIMKPSITDYRNLINIVMNIEFAKGGAWNRSRIGWFWGGMTVQGVLPYYYNAVTTPGRSQIIDRCYYNTMADTPECITQSVSELKSAHFTVCQKPWNCYRAFANDLCKDLHKRWFELRKEAEEFYNITVNTNPCPKIGLMHYKHMALQDAVLPTQNANSKYDTVQFLVPDDSPDRFDPFPEARYIN